ncbi:transposase [Frankia gtarii]|uniref:transposase n=1 Tax=Frankia gtarii TaxID=2950102 RepID=UPI0021BEE556|nr:transposase [Frankia gtarii]
MSLLRENANVESLSTLARFRDGFYDCLDARADTLFELADAVICTEGPVTSLVELSLASVFRRGHGALYDALAQGAINEERLRDLLADQLPSDGPLIFGVDATTFPRPNAECSPDRGLHYAPCRCDGDRKVVPGWEFQWVTALEWGRSSWTLPVDARRLAQDSCPVASTAEQIRDLTRRLGTRPEQAAPMFVLDQGYAAAALTHALGDLPVQTLVRIAGDRVFYDGRPGPRKPGPGRNGVHGQRFALAAKVNLRRPDQLLIVPDTTNYGRVEVRAWHRMHQRVARSGYFARLGDELFTRLPIIEGSVVEVRVERLPDGRSPHRTMWLWHSGPHAPDLDVCWRAYLRRFDAGTLAPLACNSPRCRQRSTRRHPRQPKRRRPNPPPRGPPRGLCGQFYTWAASRRQVNLLSVGATGIRRDIAVDITETIAIGRRILPTIATGIATATARPPDPGKIRAATRGRRRRPATRHPPCAASGSKRRADVHARA